jgi:hypothetical protein
MKKKDSLLGGGVRVDVLTKFGDDNAEDDAHGANELHHRDVSLQEELRMRECQI